jgi:hypothetical protein
MKLIDFFKIVENFADGKNPGRKGLAKRSGVNTKASVSSLRKTAKNSSGEKQRMAHWLANMKAGRAKKKANESIDVPEFKQVLQVFLPVAKQILNLDKIPTIILKKRLLHGDQPSMGGFNLDTYELEIAIANRQPVDILRTLAHELVHAKQSTMHKDIDGTTGSPHEDEANAIAGRIMREFNKLHPEFLTLQPVTEGGNVELPNPEDPNKPHRAERIDLTKIIRSQIKPQIDQVLRSFNQTYQNTYKVPLWSPELLQNKKFLSGSAFHFFDEKIPDEEFVTVKPKVGDIDTQVDIAQKANVEKFLIAQKGKQFGPATLVGHKPSGDQFITLWDFAEWPIKIQIDLEMVEYNQGAPTAMSQFGHSSAWADIKQGLKGVFHKYLLRALTTGSLKDRVIQMKSGKLKKVTSTDVAYSDQYGMRDKYEPVMDPATGEHKMIDGLPVYKEVSTADSTYVNNLPGMFEKVFGRVPSKQEEQQMWSSTGLVELVKANTDPESQRKIANGFMLTIYGPSAQTMYKDDPAEDQREKDIAWNFLLTQLGLANDASLKKAAADAKAQFYANYGGSKAKPKPIAEDVKPSPRQGIQHLEKMNDLEFINFVKKLKHEMKGKLNPIKMTLKVDGLGARFGKDKTGRPFFESSHSGPIFTSGSFTGHAQSRGFEGERLERAAHYDQIFDMIVNSKFIQQLPNDTKVNCEILYNPMADETDNGLKFVTVAYDRSVLGPMMTIVPFDSEVASTGQRHPMSNKIKDFLIKIKGEGDIKFVDDRLGYDGDVDLSAQIDPILSIIDGNLIAKLSSRLKVDADEKRQIKAFLQAAKDSIAQYLLQHPGIVGKDRMGKDIEGVIMHRGKEAPIKVTTPSFKQAMADKKLAQQGQQDVTKPAV